MSHKTITWEIIKKIRKSFLAMNTNKECTLISGLKSLLSEKTIKNMLGNVEKNLEVNHTSNTKEIPARNLETAARMFIYLNFCPPKIFVFYKSLFTTKSTKNWLLALSSILQVSKNTHQYSMHEQIFKSTMETINLNHYEILDNVLHFSNTNPQSKIFKDVLGM